MTETVADRLVVEMDATGRRTGCVQPTARGVVFGGQLLGQAVVAAAGPVGREAWASSVQASFPAAADPSHPVGYDVTVRRSGRRFTWTHVLATQAGARGERTVLEALVRFRSSPADPVDRAPATAAVPGPEELPDRDTLVARHGLGVADYLDRMGRDLLDLRYFPTPPPELLTHDEPVDRQTLWVRSRDVTFGSPVDAAAHLAFVSDLNLITVPLLRLGALSGSSLDHTVRYHRLPDRPDWLRYDQVSRVVAGDIVEADGTVSSRAGELLLTASQVALGPG